MRSIQVTVHHKLSEHEALSRIKHLLTKLKHDHKDKVSNINQEWHARHGKFNFTVLGFDISGTVDLHPGSIEIHGKVPLAISIFRGKIKEVLKEKGKELLAE
jgi:hypothetical protein